jgi:hypothetical protein
MDRSETDMKDSSARLMCLGLALLYLGQVRVLCLLLLLCPMPRTSAAVRWVLSTSCWCPLCLWCLGLLSFLAILQVLSRLMPAVCILAQGEAAEGALKAVQVRIVLCF